MGDARQGEHEGSILFFDGTCILCDGFADLVLRRDRHRRFRLATLQGDTAARLVSPAQAAVAKTGASGMFTTIVLVEGGRTFRKSDAVLRVLPHLGGAWRLAPVLRLVPRVLRDAVYDLVARNRLRWFGTRACRLPTAAEGDRFLP